MSLLNQPEFSVASNIGRWYRPAKHSEGGHGKDGHGARSGQRAIGSISLGRRFIIMANKSLTKSEIAAQLAEKVGITKKQVTLLLAAQADLAYKQAKNVFTVPGLGKLKLVDRPARKMIMQFGADKGKEIMVPKKKKVKFTVAKAARVAILGLKK
jgi:DNA-binding protein HU-beta